MCNDEETTIAALSGIGVNQWTLEDLKDFNNDAFQEVKAALKEKNILWADMSGDARRAAYQQMQARQPIEDEVAIKEHFKEEYKKRFRNKVKSLREVKGLSDEDIAEALKKSAEYRPEHARDYEENVIKVYVNLYKDEKSPFIEAIEKQLTGTCREEKSFMLLNCVNMKRMKSFYRKSVIIFVAQNQHLQQLKR